MVDVLLLYARYNQGISYRTPLGVAYLASILIEGKHTVSIIDGAFYTDWEQVKKDLLELSPKYIGLSASSFLMYNVIEYAKLIKEILPKTIVILGGAHASATKEECLKNENIDIVVYGEGEKTILELIDTLDKNSYLGDVKGIIFRDNDNIVTTSPREFIDLDDRPLPARDLLQMEKYLSISPTIPLPFPATDVEVTRGCFGTCKYCKPVLDKMFGPKIRSRDPVKVVDEIEMLIKKYKVKGINIGTDEPLVYKTWVKAFCEEIIKRKIKVKFICPNRVDTVYEDVLPLMKKAGFISLGFGVESGSQKILNSLNKGWQTPDKIKRAFTLCNKYGICARANIMIGSPGETKDTLKETQQLLKDIKPDLIYLAATCPTPGSFLYEETKNNGTLLVDEIDIKNFNAGYIKLEHLTPEDIVIATDEMFKTYVKLLISYVCNPINLWKKKHFFMAIFNYYWSLKKEAFQIFTTLNYYLNYGKKCVKIVNKNEQPEEDEHFRYINKKIKEG